MSTYEPGRLYLIDLDGETHEARHFAPGILAPGFLTRDGRAVDVDKATNVRPAIVLDPENQNVKAFTDPRHDPADYAVEIAAQIRAQITPPEPPMEEPTEWGTVVQTDEGRAILLGPNDSNFQWFVEGRGWFYWKNLKNPRPYENPREKPATGAESDAQGCTGCVPPHVIVNDAEVYDGEDRP